MKLMIKGFACFLFCSLVLSGSVFARPAHNYKGERGYKDVVYKDVVYKDIPLKHDHFEVIGAPGIAKLNANGLSQLGVTSSETDTLVQTNANQWDAFAAQLGVGFVHYFPYGRNYSNNVQWFPSIEPELNVYYLASNSIKGDVWRFNSPAFNQMTFDIPVHSTRLMLDAALTIASYKKLSFYAIGGIGNAWTSVSYHDTDNDSTASCPDQRVSLSSHTSTHFTWEAGLGLTYAFNHRVGVSFEYLYANLGRVNTSGSGNTGTIMAPVLIPAHFNLRTQTGLLGLHIAI